MTAVFASAKLTKPGQIVEADLSGDVAMNNTAAFFDGPSVLLGPGTWLIVGSVNVLDTAGVAGIIGKLWDGTTVERSAQVSTPGAGTPSSMTLTCVVVVLATATWKISCRDLSSTSGAIKATTVSASQGNNASGISAVRLA